MTLKTILKKVNEKTASFNAGSFDGFLAIQVTLSDLNEVFYVEIKDGKLSVEPYEYNDRQANLIISSDNFAKLVNNKLNPVAAFTTGQLKVEGDTGKALELAKLFEK